MERRAMKLLTLAAVLLFAVLPTFADSFNVFVLEITPHGQVDIQLTPNGNPLVLSFAPKPTSHFELEFFVPSFVPTLGGTALSVTLTLAGQVTDTFQTIDDCPPPGPCGFGVALTAAFFPKTVDGVVTVAINDQSETFNFRYSSISTVVPEPTTLMLFGTGLAAVVWRKHRRASA